MNGGLSVRAAPRCRKLEVRTMSKYQEFDNQIFDVTKIMIGFSLSEGQKAELLKITSEIEALIIK